MLSLQRLLLPVLLFSSGLCGIAYEILYGRMLANIIGDQFLVSTAILLTFLLGIGLGALYAHRLWRGLWLIEAGIGLYAIGFALGQQWIESMLYSWLPGAGTSALASLIVAVLLLLLPAFLIGVSLPLFAGYAQQLRPRQGYFAASYAVYNFGAAATVIVIEFWLIREVGIRDAVLYMGALNLLVAAALLTLYAELSRGAVTAAKPSAAGFSKAVLAALAISSVASAIFQLSAVRLTEMLLGPYRESFAYVLCVVLAGIALGSLLVSRFRIRFAALMVANIVALGWILGGLTLVMQWYAGYYQQVADNYWAQVGFKLLCISVLFLGPATTFGATIPALLNTLLGEADARGRDAARSPGYLLYIASLANASGFLIMFLVLHKRLDYGDLLLLVALLSGASLVVIGLLADRPQPSPLKIKPLPAGLAVALAALLIGGRLAWNEELLYQGHYSFKSAEAMDKLIADRATSERYKGEQDVLSISHRDGNTYFIINGKISIRLEAAAEKIVGALGGVFAEDRGRAMVLGVGSGATAGAVGLLFDEVDAVEISGVILETLPRLEQHNFGIVGMDNVALIHDDAIHAVKVSDGGYSLILNTVTSPLFFSSSKLYTVDFLQDVRSKLAPGGLYMTWLDSRVGDRGADIMLESVSGSFEHCGLAQLGRNYLVMLCSDRPIVAHHPMAVADEPRLAAYFRDQHDIDPAGIAYQLINTDAAALVNNVRAPLNTLDYPVLEFEMARLGRRSLADLHRRIIGAVDAGELGKAFRNFDWGLEAMTGALEKSTGGNQYYQKLRLLQLKYKTYFDAAVKARRRGDCEFAEEMMIRALAVEGKAANRDLLLGHCQAMQGQHREALQAYTRALQNQPENSRINLYMGRINVELARFSTAYDQLQRVAADQRDAAWHYLMAEVLGALDNDTEAERYYREAVALAGSLEAAAASARQLDAE